jgi:HJR/Mrr/RecB family endonuclease
MEGIVLGIVIVIVVIFLIVGKINNNASEKESIRRHLNEISNNNYNLSKENEKLKNEISYNQHIFSDEKNILIKENEELKKEYDRIKTTELSWTKRQISIKDNLLKEINENLTSREKAYNWIAPIIADIRFMLKETSRRTDELITTKRSYLTNVRVNLLVEEKRKLLEENAVLKYQIEYIKTLIPVTEDIIEFDEYRSEEDTDNSNRFLSKEEYRLLSDTEKNIRALEYYKNRSKRNWEIGRDFERYIGYTYEQMGYDVEYFGIEKKLEDLGRDLIAKKNSITAIIQCKYWSKQKRIYEKHIAQLYGTLVMYQLDNPNEHDIRGLFVSHTQLSDKAKEFAEALGIEILENIELGEYPLIKCHNGRDKEFGCGTKIYHLPLDQQYDITKVNKKNGDFYAFTVLEAERAGYRRAYKWHGGE